MNKLIRTLILASSALGAQHSHITVATLDVKPMTISWVVEDHSKDCKEIFRREEFTINLKRAIMSHRLGDKDFDPEEAAQVMGGILEDLPGLQATADLCTSSPIQMISIRPDKGTDDILTNRLLIIEGWPDPLLDCGGEERKKVTFDPTALGKFANSLIRYVMASTIWWKEQLSHA